MNAESTIINMTDIENPKVDDDVKINIYQRKSECIRMAENEKMEDEADICCICLDNMAGDTHIYITCGHKIHDECYKELSISNKLDFCPLCRAREPIRNNNITTNTSETIIENLGDGNVQIINIINLRVSRVHPEGIRERNSTFIQHKLAIVLSIIWLLILIGIIIFALTPVFK